MSDIIAAHASQANTGITSSFFQDPPILYMGDSGRTSTQSGTPVVNYGRNYGVQTWESTSSETSHVINPAFNTMAPCSLPLSFYTTQVTWSPSCDAQLSKDFLLPNSQLTKRKYFYYFLNWLSIGLKILEVNKCWHAIVAESYIPPHGL